MNIPFVTKADRIGMSWLPPQFDGGSDVLDYKLWYDNASGGTTWTEVEAGITVTSYTITGLTQGLTYQFKVQARNDYGFSDYSEPMSALAAQVPAQPQPPSTSFADGQVTITWVAPDNGGSPIVAYTVVIQTSDGTTYLENTDYCDGSLASVISSTTCIVPALVLHEEPYGWPWASSITAQVVASN